MPVELSTHWPHIRQSNSSPLTARSTAATGRSSRSVADRLPAADARRRARARTADRQRFQAAGVAHRPEAHGEYISHASCGFRSRRRRGLVDALGADQPLEVGVAVAGLPAARLRRAPRPRGSSPHCARRAALPVGEVGVRAAPAGAHRGAVDRFLEARRQLHVGGLAAALDDDLRGNVAPGDDDQLGHGRTSGAGASREAALEPAVAGAARTRRRDRAVAAAARAPAMRSGVSRCAR